MSMQSIFAKKNDDRQVPEIEVKGDEVTLVGRSSAGKDSYRERNPVRSAPQEIRSEFALLIFQQMPWAVCHFHRRFCTAWSHATDTSNRADSITGRRDHLQRWRKDIREVQWRRGMRRALLRIPPSSRCRIF